MIPSNHIYPFVQTVFLSFPQVEQNSACARQKFYQEKTTPAAAASRRTRRAANQNPNGIPS
jgi:hypothetical protein